MIWLFITWAFVAIAAGYVLGPHRGDDDGEAGLSSALAFVVMMLLLGLDLVAFAIWGLIHVL